ncbi:response regulator [Acidimangrovimonas sediminis]|uniref:response regulator n=1 Tax=Acidimangrovimonas sediminis TaxID=2056283 RepID=UPI000C802B89|nr:response regulator transcription factor [Acidimangrovimonas sediminis]
MRVLLIEDDESAARYVKRALEESGHVCDVLSDGHDGLFHASRERYDVLVVDRMLPGLDGLALVRALRATDNRTPILFLTAIDGVDDRVEGLEAGGDDYLVKPFALSELLARVNALGRRPQHQPVDTVLRVGDLELDLVQRTARRGGTPIALLAKEFRLLEVLMRNQGRIVTRSMLLERVWDFHFDPQTSVVETHISRLRAKLDRPFPQPMLHTVKNAGYCLRPAR